MSNSRAFVSVTSVQLSSLPSRRAGRLLLPRILCLDGEKRRGMKKLLSLVEQQAVDVVLLEDPDRLVRFGFSSLQETFRWQQVRLEVLDPPAQVDPTTALLAAMLTIVTVFSRKRYAYRAHANPRRKKALSRLVPTPHL